MLFNSFEFTVLLALVFPTYFLLRHHRRQNLLLLVASYVFYGWWDYRFISLLALSTLTDYFVARHLERTQDHRKRRLLLLLSCGVNLGLLGTFKYWDLFASTANGFGHALGIESALLPELQIILPVGISFYTFQTLAYSIDVYRRRIPACRSLLDFALYVSFFPQLVAGPIERPGNLLPQLRTDRRIDLDGFEEGAFLFASGWFRKSLGDVMASVADPAFADPASASPWTLLWGAYAFAFQIYLDFSGYTDMARGVARALGIRLMVNFRAPYFSTNVREFWQRWHISLSTWLRDYLYIPLGGNRGGGRAVQRNLMITMFLGGLWHGAAWNFAIWGLLHGVYLAVHRVITSRSGRVQPSRGPVGRVIAAILTFHLVLVGWVFFRARPVGDSGALAVAVDYLSGLAGLPGTGWIAPPVAFLWLFLVLVIDWQMERSGHAYWSRDWPWPVRGGVIALMILLGFVLGSGESRAFIYFQF